MVNAVSGGYARRSNAQNAANPAAFFLFVLFGTLAALVRKPGGGRRPVIFIRATLYSTRLDNRRALSILWPTVLLTDEKLGSEHVGLTFVSPSLFFRLPETPSAFCSRQAGGACPRRVEAGWTRDVP
jgi:hypothetical protein